MKPYSIRSYGFLGGGYFYPKTLDIETKIVVPRTIMTMLILIILMIIILIIKIIRKIEKIYLKL